MLDTVVALLVDDDDCSRKQDRRRLCDNDWDVVRGAMGEGE